MGGLTGGAGMGGSTSLQFNMQLNPTLNLEAPRRHRRLIDSDRFIDDRKWEEAYTPAGSDHRVEEGMFILIGQDHSMRLRRMSFNNRHYAVEADLLIPTVGELDVGLFARIDTHSPSWTYYLTTRLGKTWLAKWTSPTSWVALKSDQGYHYEVNKRYRLRLEVERRMLRGFLRGVLRVQVREPHDIYFPFSGKAGLRVWNPTIGYFDNVEVREL
jgi:hypothetical protein